MTRTDRYDCTCHANTCRCTDKPATAERDSLSLALDGPITASAADIHQMLTRSAFAGPLLDAYDATLKRYSTGKGKPADRSLLAYQAACLRQLAAQKLSAHRVATLDTSLTPAPLTASQALGAITTDPPSAPVLRAYNAAMRTGNVVAAAQFAKILRYRARTIHDDVQRHERADAMAALEARVYAANPKAGDWARLKRRADKGRPSPATPSDPNTPSTEQGKADA